MKKRVAVMVMIIMSFATVSWANLSKADKKQIKSELKGALYMRVDAPCATGRHAYGTYKRPLVEASPEGTNTDADTVLNASWWHADSTYWGIRINDPVEVDEVDIEADEGEIEVELEGVGPAEDNSTVIKLVKIYSYADFKAAFEQVFARGPLQDEHGDWSAEIKQAIADRKIMDGMSKRQVFYITGTPDRFEKSTEEGKGIEVWHLRQDQGMKMGYFTTKMGEKSKLPAMVRFEDGTVVGAGEAGTRNEFSLD